VNLTDGEIAKKVAIFWYAPLLYRATFKIKKPYL
jgi:hypothetical protein